MATDSIEQRVAALESQVAELLMRRRQDADQPKDWRRTIGMFAGDEVMQEICRNALTDRDEDRRRWLAEFDANEGRCE
ncbi:MAG TPA: hypothetical protein VGI40_22220 [Pirellulaceae bacterium]|jgi:phosphate uptake regulator